MKIVDITLPKDADLRMVVVAILTAATCNVNLPPAEAEEMVCALYERYRTTAEEGERKKTLQTWGDLS